MLMTAFQSACEAAGSTYVRGLCVEQQKHWSLQPDTRIGPGPAAVSFAEHCKIADSQATGMEILRVTKSALTRQTGTDADTALPRYRILRRKDGTRPLIDGWAATGINGMHERYAYPEAPEGLPFNISSFLAGKSLQNWTDQCSRKFLASSSAGLKPISAGP